jgi:hypothetical protein
MSGRAIEQVCVDMNERGFGLPQLSSSPDLIRRSIVPLHRGSWTAPSSMLRSTIASGPAMDRRIKSGDDKERVYASPATIAMSRDDNEGVCASRALSSMLRSTIASVPAMDRRIKSGDDKERVYAHPATIAMSGDDDGNDIVPDAGVA